MDRHFAYFDQNTGAWIRECRGPVPDPDIDTRLVGDARLGALNTWQQRIAPAGQDEVGLDVTHIGWPVGDFCYCAFDPVTRLLDWGPERFYIEIEMMALEVVANQRSHRPIRDAAPGQRVLAHRRASADTGIRPTSMRSRARLARASCHRSDAKPSERSSIACARPRRTSHCAASSRGVNRR